MQTRHRHRLQLQQGRQTFSKPRVLGTHFPSRRILCVLFMVCHAVPPIPIFSPCLVLFLFRSSFLFPWSRSLSPPFPCGSKVFVEYRTRIFLVRVLSPTSYPHSFPSFSFDMLGTESCSIKKNRIVDELIEAIPHVWP